MTRLIPILVGCLLAAGASGPRKSEAGLERCLGIPAEDERARCVDAFLADLAADDGMTRLTWIPGDDSPRWSVALDEGDGRIGRVASALLEAGRKDAVRPLLERVLAVGGEDWARQAWEKSGGGSVRGLDARRSDLRAPPWLPALPDLDVALVGGGRVALSSARGKVLVLDFWASWCAPCLQELPRLQELYAAEKGLGFEAIAINVDEPEPSVREAVKLLKLTMPVGLYSKGLDAAFAARRLPTVILADREGRIRGRWDGYVSGTEREIAGRARQLMQEDPRDLYRKVADVCSGAGALEIRWMRDLGQPIGGVAVVRAPGSAPRIAASAGSEIVLLEVGGKTAGRLKAPFGEGRLRSVDLQGSGEIELVGFRPGGTRFAVFLPDGKVSTLSAPAVLLDLAVLPASGARTEPGRLALGTVSGLYLAQADGGLVRPVSGTGEITAVEPSGPGSPTGLVAIEAGGRIVRIDGAGKIAERLPAPAGSYRLVVRADDRQGLGVVPSSANAVATGRFLEGKGVQAAIATGAGRLGLVDLDRREMRWLALWPGITDLAASDLDGDGRDELIVATERFVAVLAGPARDPN